MSKTRLCSLFLLATLLLPASLSAQESYYLADGEDFLQKTRFIFTGRVVDQHSFWSEDGRFIMTRYTFQVGEVIKGEPGAQIDLVEYGGQVGEQGMRISHAAAYSLGEAYLVFSYLDLLEHNRTFAGTLGRLPLLSDESGRRLVRIYPGHPVREVLDKDQMFLDEAELSASLRRIVRNSPR